MSIQMARRAAVMSSRISGGGGGLPVTSGLRGQWESDGITSPPADGAALQNWTDLSGAGATATQATSGNRPVYRTTGAFLPNGEPCVEFTAASSQYLTATLSQSGAATRFMVIRLKTLPGNQTVTSSPLQALVNSSGKLLTAVENVTWLVEFGGAATLAVDTWYVLAVTDNGSNSNVTYVDGTQDSTSSTAHTNSGTALNFGSKINVGEYLNGYLAAVIEYNRVLNSTELGQVNDYLTDKFVGGGTPGTSWAGYLDFDWDVNDTTQWDYLHPWADWRKNQVHQAVRQNTRTRLGIGYAERVEVHDDNNDRYGYPADTSSGARFAAHTDCVGTNEGGSTDVGQNCYGWRDVYWTASLYFPTSPDPDATVVGGFSQTQAPGYAHLLELHDYCSSSVTPDPGVVQPHAIMARSNQLQYRQWCGTTTHNGSNWVGPTVNTGTPGTSGINDQIPIPIVKASGTNATLPMNTWIDIIWRIKFSLGADGLVELWAREAGQAFSVGPNLTLSGPTDRRFISGDGTWTTTDIEVAGGQAVSGHYLMMGFYTGGHIWSDANEAFVMIMDETRRWGTLIDAKANWG